jgi:hypothetical protein
MNLIRLGPGHVCLDSRVLVTGHRKTARPQDRKTACLTADTCNAPHGATRGSAETEAETAARQDGAPFVLHEASSIHSNRAVVPRVPIMYRERVRFTNHNPVESAYRTPRRLLLQDVSSVNYGTYLFTIPITKANNISFGDCVEM